MERRPFLALLASTVGATAGCLGSNADAGPGTGPATGTGTSPTGSPAGSPSPTAATEATLESDRHTVRLSAPRVRASVVKVTTSSTHFGVVRNGAGQFVLADASNDVDPEELPLALAVDRDRAASRIHEIGGGDGPPTLAFPVSSYDSPVSRVSVVLGDGDRGVADRWVLPDAVVTAVNNPPSFRIESFDVPETVDYRGRFEASFTVANEGERDARYVVEFGVAALSDQSEVSVTVPAGESRTVTRTFEHYEHSGTGVTVVLGEDLRRATVEVVGTPTATDRSDE